MSFSLGNERPPCSNSKCSKGAHMLIGKNFFCGDCGIKAVEYLNEQRDAYVMERFKNES